jgi:hypothetical protein
VASAHGLDTGAYTFAYVTGWASEVPGVEVDQVVRDTANRVLAASKVILAATEHLLEPADQPQVLEPDLTLAADAGRGAERTATLLTTATALADDTRGSPTPSHRRRQRRRQQRPCAGQPAPVLSARRPPERLVEVHAPRGRLLHPAPARRRPDAVRAAVLWAGVASNATSRVPPGWATHHAPGPVWWTICVPLTSAMRSSAAPVWSWTPHEGRWSTGSVTG